MTPERRIEFLRGMARTSEIESRSDDTHGLPSRAEQLRLAAKALDEIAATLERYESALRHYAARKNWWCDSCVGREESFREQCRRGGLHALNLWMGEAESYVTAEEALK